LANRLGGTNGCGEAPFHEHEHHQSQQAEPHRGEQERVRPALAEAGETVRQRAEPDGAHHGARDVQSGRGRGIPALRDVAQRDDDDQRGQRQVDEEDGPPVPLDEPAAEERADSAGDAAEP
jgi:predicted  nucleic acid-binding Zn-ribbon protein